MLKNFDPDNDKHILAITCAVLGVVFLTAMVVGLKAGISLPYIIGFFILFVICSIGSAFLHYMEWRGILGIFTSLDRRFNHLILVILGLGFIALFAAIFNYDFLNR